MAYEAKGKIEVILDTQQVTQSFKKREFVLEIQDGMYSEHIKMQLTQDRCDILDGFNVGDEVNVSFNLKGRPYTKGTETIYFTNIDAWKVEPLNTAAPSQPADTNQAPTTGSQDDISGMSFSEGGEDELPF